jgi:hypothetical protein
MDLRHEDFSRLVKRTREKFGVSIQEAHDLIFADKELRRLVAHRVIHDTECRRMAQRDIRLHCGASRFIDDGNRITFRRADGQRGAN